jgi:hypothetical protein
MQATVTAHEILWDVRCRRILTAFTLAVLAMGVLSACQTKIGQAASAGGATLSNSDLASYLKPGTGPYTPAGSTQQVVPKVLVLTTWARTQLLNSAINDKGGPATTSELNSARAAVQAQNPVQQAEKSYARYGFANKFGDLLFDETVRLVVLVERLANGITAAQALQVLQGSQSAQVNNAIGSSIAKANKAVQISPRYGRWDVKTVAVSATRSGAPAFVKFPA